MNLCKKLINLHSKLAVKPDPEKLRIAEEFWYPDEVKKYELKPPNIYKVKKFIY
jgi:hypothetical protein